MRKINLKVVLEFVHISKWVNFEFMKKKKNGPTMDETIANGPDGSPNQHYVLKALVNFWYFLYIYRLIYLNFSRQH